MIDCGLIVTVCAFFAVEMVGYLLGRAEGRAEGRKAGYSAALLDHGIDPAVGRQLSPAEQMIPEGEVQFDNEGKFRLRK